MNFRISDLRERPDFAEQVARRIWSQWWQPRGVPLDTIRGRLQENLNAAAIPFALVAHQDSTFLGTASVIASDLEEVPELTPWVAAVFVEAAHRHQQIGRALVMRAADEVFALGVAQAYLCALPARRNFYQRLGWQPIMENVGARGLTVFVQPAYPADVKGTAAADRH